MTILMLSNTCNFDGDYSDFMSFGKLKQRVSRIHSSRSGVEMKNRVGALTTSLLPKIFGKGGGFTN